MLEDYSFDLVEWTNTKARALIGPCKLIPKECLCQKRIRKLNKLQPQPGVIQGNRTNPDRLQGNVAKMTNFLSRLGLTLDDIDNLRVIHVTGTKGKGSTCAFVESILRHHGFKTGLLSSPYMVEVRERIRINGRPIDKDRFNDYFRRIDKQLKKTTNVWHQGTKNNPKPGYISFLTVLGLYVFHHEHVDVVILEEGYSGVNDNTNVVRHPVVCGIASFSEDHVTPGGPTFEELVYNKAGILKDGARAISVEQTAQTELVMEVLKRRSEEKNCPLYIAPPMMLEQLADNELGLAGDIQVVNAGLAVQLCQFWLECYSKGTENAERALEDRSALDQVTGFRRLDGVTLTREIKIIAGLTRCRWNTCPQIISKKGITFYLDGADTLESLQNCVRWFTKEADKEKAQIQRENGKICRALVFNFIRDHPVDNYLNCFLGLEFDLAAFCPVLISTNPEDIPEDHYDSTVDPQVMFQRAVTLQEAWSQLPLNPNHSAVFRCSALALRWVTLERYRSFRNIPTGEFMPPEIPALPNVEDATHIQVLVTGNPLLIASVLQLIDPFMNF